jgi:beta-lactamase superfamily II metal-dependent hydrolase
MNFLYRKIFLLLILSYTLIWAQAPLKIYCIDVNTGSSTLIVSPTNKYVLIDAGMTNYGNSTVYPFLQSLGITHLDYTIVTHYHEDHIGGLDEVIYALSGFDSNDSILNWCYDRGDSSPPSNTIYTGYANAAGSKRRVIGLGETLNLGGGAFMYCIARNGTVMNGVGVIPSSGENYRSCAFILVYNNFRLYVGGDLTGNPVSGDPAVEPNAAPFTGDVNVYVVNHHGGRNSSVNVFLDSLRPETAIFSQGTIPSNNGHPHQESIDRLVAHNTYMYQMNNNPSGGTIPSGHGRILNTTAVVTVNQASYTINGDEYLLSGVERDGACLEILSPPDTIPEETVITPKALIKNLGNATESFRVRFKISPAYNRTQAIYGLAPNDTMTVAFDTAWYAIRGIYQVVCSTEVFGDTFCGNDKQTSTLVVAFYDNELQEILSPRANSQFYFGETLFPQVIIKDNSEYAYPSSVKVFCLIRNNDIIYFDSLQRNSISQTTDTIIFSPMPILGISEGVYQCSVWVTRNNDLVTTNNVQSVQFTILDPNSIIEEQILSIPYNNLKFKTLQMKLYNISGRLVKVQTIYNPSDNVIKPSDNWLKNLPPGIYFLHLIGTTADKQKPAITITKKIIILPQK